MADYWFKPKSHGYGAAPANWKGWAATAVFVAIVYAILSPLVFASQHTGEAPTAGDVAASIGLIIIVTIAFVWLSKVKTDGAWKWRWGERS